MRPDPKAEVLRWLRQAEHDLSDADYSLACFLCQQAAEKALMAFLYSQGAEQVLGHSVADLAAECGNLDGEFRVLKPKAGRKILYTQLAPGFLNERLISTDCTVWQKCASLNLHLC